MTKAIISNRIYLNKPNEGFDDIKKALTYKIEHKAAGRGGKHSVIEVIKNYKLLPKDIISIPQGRTDLIPEGYEVIDKRILVDMPFPDPRVQLRPEQAEVINKLTDTCIVNAPVGWGKSYSALHAVRNLGQKALIVTHNTLLRDQWVEGIQEIFGFTPAVIGSGAFDMDSAIVVGNIQTLSKNLLELSKEFGTIVVDECLDYETEVDTLEYGKIRIGVLVNSKKPCSVLSMDPNTGITSYKRVLDYHRNPLNCTPIRIYHDGGGNFKCTPNHGVFTYFDNKIVKVPARELKVGMPIIQSILRHRSTHMINKEWYPILLGLVLGDGSLQYPHKTSSSIRLMITHGEDQKDYFNWKMELLHSMNPVITNGKSGYCNKKNSQLITKSFIDEHGWKESLYSDNRTGSKVNVPKYISNILNKQSWALIYQDDGSTTEKANSIVFSICELDEKSGNNLLESLNKLFGVQGYTFVCSRGFRYLRLNKEDSLIFKQGISEFVHPSMYYKLTGIDTTSISFKFDQPLSSIFNEHFAIRYITNIEDTTFTSKYKFNIEVEDNHTYFAADILVSNCHKTPATTFTDLVDSSYARYRIGLSGTVKRKDGKHVILRDYFGTTLYKPEQSHTLNPVVKLLKPGVSLSIGDVWAKKINNLLYDPDYQEYISVIAKAQMAKGHSVLIVADRVEFLNNVKELIGEDCMCITGETSFEERKTIADRVEEGTTTAVAASRSIFSEGISINRLSCIILATPIANEVLLEQLIGRIMRLHPKKIQPEVIDIQFSGPADRKQNNLRTKFYLEKGWRLVSI